MIVALVDASKPTILCTGIISLSFGACWGVRISAWIMFVGCEHISGFITETPSSVKCATNVSRRWVIWESMRELIRAKSLSCKFLLLLNVQSFSSIYRTVLFADVVEKAAGSDFRPAIIWRHIFERIQVFICDIRYDKAYVTSNTVKTL